MTGFAVGFLATISFSFLVPPLILFDESSPIAMLTKLVSYSTSLLCHDLASVTIGGKCMLGEWVVPCDTLELGDEVTYVCRSQPLDENLPYHFDTAL